MIPLIDTHLHLIEPGRFRYPWAGDVPQLARSFSFEQYAALARRADVQAAVFMEVDVHEEDMGEEATFFAARAESEGEFLSGVVASGRPEHAGFEDYLDRIASPQLKGIRRVLHVAPDDLPRSPLFRRNVRMLGQRGLAFDLCILPRQHTTALELVDACPDTRFVLDHCGNPDLRNPDLFGSWRGSLEEFGKRPNVVAKISGLVSSSPIKPVPFEFVRPYLDATIESFGVGRCLWGSDWPFCTLTTTMEQWVALFRKWLAGLSDDEQRSIGNSNAQLVYGLHLPTKQGKAHFALL